MKTTKKLKSGFTIVETLVYLFIFAIIFVSFIGVFVVVDKNGKAATREKQLQDTAIFLSEHIQDSFSNSTQILLPTLSGSELQLAQVPQCLSAPCSNTPTAYYDYTLALNQVIFSKGVALPLVINKTLNDSINAKVLSINFDSIINSKSIVTGVRATIVLQAPNDININYTLQTNYSLL